MQTEFRYATLASDDDWVALAEDLDQNGAGSVLRNLLQTLRSCGARLFVEESAYVDRDFSAAYAAFYSTLYRPRSRFCRRIHFFASELPAVWEAKTKDEMAWMLEQASGDYLGYVIVRPLNHAPVGSAVISAPHFERPGSEISVRSDFAVHLLGARLLVRGIPVTEQDTRTGSCAQATIWTAGRHFHNRYAMPWFSVIDITEAALKPTDSLLASSLPAGSDYLTDDNMVRALRAMGEHPIIYSRGEDDDWSEPPARTVARYVDSGIPVIVALKRGKGVGHAVVAVGMRQTQIESPHWVDGEEAASGDRVTHFLVNDDQRGAYVELAVKGPGREARDVPDTGEVAAVGAPDDHYTLDDAIFFIVPLPNKVFIKAEVAETLARDKLDQVSRGRAKHIKEVHKDLHFEAWAVDPDFYAAKAGELIARTYLTHGWKYKHRLMRNGVPEDLKGEVTGIQLPRYVWVTEFSLPSDVLDPDPCARKVRAHVVVDATGSSSRFEDPVLVTHIPGIILVQTFDPERPAEDSQTALTVLLSDKPYLPKVRGWYDFSSCAAPATGMDDAGEVGA